MVYVPLQSQTSSENRKGGERKILESHSILWQIAGENCRENGIHHLWLDVGVAVEQ